MSQINSAVLSRRHPNLREALESLNTWLQAHSNDPCIDVRRLSRALKSIPVEDLLATLEVLIDEGIYTQKYGVEDRMGKPLSEDHYESLGDIPRYLTDDFTQNLIQSEDFKVVPILVKE